ncbi:MAG: hypothetical protein II374_04825 [Lachnospiraceae bacterium]|nr:hypothetical protein [Lachnospiraceae bacterium]MBQ2320650.1 hypothetical protein [Lachnospiraceae bacterium]
MESFVGRSQDVFMVTETRRERRIFIVTCAICILIAIGIFVLGVNLFLNKKYNSYEVLESTSVTTSGNVKYEAYQNKMIKYSRDGISALDSSGNIIWNGSYDMIEPAVDISGKYVVVADIGGKTVSIYNGEDTGKEISTDYPIVQACVSSQGIVAVALEQESSNVINIYNPYDISDKLLVEIPTNVDEGYLVCMDLSADGMNLAATYVCITGGQVQSRVAFYNFSDVGKNTNCLVGAKNYDDKIVSDIRYLGENNICIFADDGFQIWGEMKKPEEVYHKNFKETIKSAFCNSEYTGVILATGSTSKPYRMNVFDMKGKMVLDMEFSDEYTEVKLYNTNEIILNSASGCTIFRLNGVKKFSTDIDGKVLKVFPSEKRNRYYLVTDSKIQKIKLSKKS